MEGLVRRTVSSDSVSDDPNEPKKIDRSSNKEEESGTNDGCVDGTEPIASALPPGQPLRRPPRLPASVLVSSFTTTASDSTERTAERQRLMSGDVEDSTDRTTANASPAVPIDHSPTRECESEPSGSAEVS